MSGFDKKSDNSRESMGALIESIVRRQGMPIATFAKQVGIARSTAYNLFRSRSADIDLIKRASRVLGRDLVAEFYSQPDAGSANRPARNEFADHNKIWEQCPVWQFIMSKKNEENAFHTTLTDDK